MAELRLIPSLTSVFMQVFREESLPRGSPAAALIIAAAATSLRRPSDALGPGQVQRLSVGLRVRGVVLVVSVGGRRGRGEQQQATGGRGDSRGRGSGRGRGLGGAAGQAAARGPRTREVQRLHLTVTVHLGAVNILPLKAS